MTSRPPEIETGQDGPIRRDFISVEVDKVYPDLPTSGSTDRNRFLMKCDDVAYDGIKKRFPDFLPPFRKYFQYKNKPR